MSDTSCPLSRRDFLKLTGLGLGTLALRPWTSRLSRGLLLPDFPAAEILGRNCIGGKIQVKTQPDINSTTVKEAYEDTVFPWLREVSATNMDYNHIVQRWVETPDGYVYSPYLQPCRNLPNTPLTAMPTGKTGFWAEVTVPYVDFVLDNPPASPGFKYLVDNQLPTRLYYSQVFWIDQIKVSNSTGNLIYRVNENGGRPAGVTGGGSGDLMWAEAAAFRPITEEEIAPLSADVDPQDKKVVVNATDQTLSCLEKGKEVYFCRVSTGLSDGSTPPGDFAIWRKTLSIHMAGGTVAAGYDTAGIAWTSLFVGEGVAIHATFWHNFFGEKRSHGCVNCMPEDAKWIFRWTSPAISLDVGDVTWTNWQSGSSHVTVEERYS